MEHSEKKTYHVFASEICTIVTYISLSIIYCNIMISSRAPFIIFESFKIHLSDIKVIEIIIFLILFAPVVTSTFVIWEFFKESYHRFLADLKGDENQYYLIYRLSQFVGNIIFVAGISVFVAYQSADYLNMVSAKTQVELRLIFRVTELPTKTPFGPQ